MRIDSKIAVVILNYNGKHLLEKFLPGILSKSQEATVYVIDNGSSDDSVSWLEQFSSVVNIIKLSGNYGYAGGYNRGLKHVHNDICCLLNNDVEVDQNWLEPIKTIFHESSDIGAFQPHILDYSNRIRYEYAGAAGGYLDFLGFPYCRGRVFNKLEDKTDRYNGNAYVFWASGACLFLRKKVFDELSGFDEDFFAHQEEIDFCWRLQRKGYDIVTSSDSKVYHLGGGTLMKSPYKIYLNHRNSLVMLLKNLPLGLLYIIIPIRLVIDFFVGLFYLFCLRFGSFLAIIKSHISVYTTIKQTILKRKSFLHLPFVRHYKAFSVSIIYLRKLFQH